MHSGQNKIQTLILGAGLSGLLAAYFLGDNYLILEKDSTPGGYCRTIPNDRYIWDYAGHFYHFSQDKYRSLFKSLVEPTEIIHQTKNTKIYYHDQLIDYPFQMNIHQLDKPEFIDCLYDLYTKDPNAPQANFLEMLYAKFGKAITEKFLKPYNEKLYATDLDKLDKDAMGRFFPYADLDAIIRNMKIGHADSYNDTFLYLKKGTGYFIDKLYHALDHDKIQLNQQIESIDISNHTATTTDGHTIRYQNLINTAPLNQFLELLPSQYSELSNKLSYNKVLVLNLGFDRPSPNYQAEHWIYFPDKSLNFYRIGFYNNILGQSELSVYVEIGFPKDQQDIDVDQEIKKALDGMKQVGIIDNNMKLMDKNTILMDPAYVHISAAESKKVNQALDELEAHRIYSLGRYGRWTYNAMEDCMSLADELAKRLKQQDNHAKQ